jgi:transcriptional regulator with XRE-family HTH domain
VRYVETIGERIRRIRLVRRRYLNDMTCSLVSFRKRAGVSEDRMRQIESGELAGILLTEGQRFSELLGVSSEYLISGDMTIEDRAREEILFLPQIGSMMHAARMAIASDEKRGLKSIADRLGINDMDLMRMESLSRSKHFRDDTFLRRVSSVLGLSIEDLRHARENSFPRAGRRKDAAYEGEELVLVLRDRSRVIRTHRFRAEIDGAVYENLVRRLEFELGLL